MERIIFGLFYAVEFLLSALLNLVLSLFEEGKKPSGPLSLPLEPRFSPA